jgi:hypothetical protein
MMPCMFLMISILKMTSIIAQINQLSLLSQSRGHFLFVNYKLFFFNLFFSGKEGIYLEDHVADNVVDDRFSFRSNDPNNYSPSFYHFRPSKTSVSRPGGSIRKESRSDSPFYKAGNSYTGKKMGVLFILIHTSGNFDNKSFLKSRQYLALKRKLQVLMYFYFEI